MSNNQLTTSMIFPGELKEDSGLGVLAKQFEIDVDEVGVEGAKTFFEAKVHLDKLIRELCNA